MPNTEPAPASRTPTPSPASPSSTSVSKQALPAPPTRPSTPLLLSAFDTATSDIQLKLFSTENQLIRTSANLAASSLFLDLKEASITSLRYQVTTLQDALKCATDECKEQKSRIAQLKIDACEKAKVIAQLRLEIAEWELKDAKKEGRSCVQEGDREEEGGRLERVESDTC